MSEVYVVEIGGLYLFCYRGLGLLGPGIRHIFAFSILVGLLVWDLRDLVIDSARIGRQMKSQEFTSPFLTSFRVDLRTLVLHSQCAKLLDTEFSLLNCTCLGPWN